jgi:Zn ribbon nucleic-acid-binding protein
MSGFSDSQDCPRCSGKNTLMTYSDWKPFDTISGTCVRCGFSYYTKAEILELNELKAERENYDYTEKVKFSKEEKKQIKEFDKNSGWL